MMQPNTHKPVKLGDSPTKKRRDQRRRKWKNIKADKSVYVFSFLGTIARPLINVKDMVINWRIVDFSFVIIAVLASLVSAAAMESEGSLEGKKKNRKRRWFVAFISGTGALALLQEFLG